MAKESGMGWTTLSVDDGSGAAQDIKNDVHNFEFATPRGVQDVTGVDKFAIERILLLADFSIQLNGTFNDAANKSHVVFKTVPTSSVNRAVSLEISGQTLACECIFTDYNLTRADNGSLTWQAPGVLADGTAPTWN